MGHDSHVAMIAEKSGRVPSKLALARSRMGAAALASAPHTLHPRRGPSTCCRPGPAQHQAVLAGHRANMKLKPSTAQGWSTIYPMVDNFGKVSSSQNENVESWPVIIAAPINTMTPPARI